MLGVDVASDECERVALGASDLCRCVPCRAWQVYRAGLGAGVVGGERERVAEKHLIKADYPCLARQVHRAALDAGVVGGERERVASRAADSCLVTLPCVAGGPR